MNANYPADAEAELFSVSSNKLEKGGKIMFKALYSIFAAILMDIFYWPGK